MQCHYGRVQGRVGRRRPAYSRVLDQNTGYENWTIKLENVVVKTKVKLVHYGCFYL